MVPSSATRYNSTWGACSIKNTFLHIDTDDGKGNNAAHIEHQEVWHRHHRSGSEPPTRRANEVPPAHGMSAEDDRADSSEGGEGGDSQATSSEGMGCQVLNDANGLKSSGSSCDSTVASSGRGGRAAYTGSTFDRTAGGFSDCSSGGSSGRSPPPSSNRGAHALPATDFFRLVTPPTEAAPAPAKPDAFGSVDELLNMTWVPCSGPGLRNRPSAPLPAPVGGSSGRPPKQDPMPWGPSVTTVMIRQVPRTFTQRQLLEEAAARGFGRVLDFAYLPFDLRKGARRCGYGFVNFIAPEYALAFRDAFDGTYIDRRSRDKGRPLRVHPAEVQGYAANYAHFSSTRVGQRNDPEFGPLFFHHLDDGQQEQCQIALPPDGMLACRTPVPKDTSPAKGPVGRRAGGAQKGRSKKGITGIKDGQGFAERPNFCTFCGSRLQPAFKFCAICGVGLDQQLQASGPLPPSAQMLAPQGPQTPQGSGPNFQSQFAAQQVQAYSGFVYEA